MAKKGFINEVLNEKGRMIQLLIIAIILSLGISFIGASLIKLLDFSDKTNLYIGISILIISLIYFTINFSKKSSDKISIDAAIYIDRTKNKIVSFPDYYFTERIGENLKSAFLENTVLKKTWEKNPLSWKIKNKGSDHRKSMELVIQAVEYDILKILSEHLLVYFYYNPKPGKRLKTYKRKDIPEILFNNPFLELFSTPQEKREAFWESTQKDSKEIRESLSSSISPEGHKYEKFELTLPVKSKIEKPETGYFKILSRFIELNIKITSIGYSAKTPKLFTKYYLGVKNYDKVEKFGISIDIQYKLKKIAMLFNNSWLYEKWIDNFLLKLEHNYSLDLYLKRIDWTNIKALLKTKINYDKITTHNML